MKLSTPRYSLCLFFQLIFILCDLVLNCVSLFPRSRDSLLVIFIFQDLFLVLSVTLLLMSLFSTYLFQAGLVEVVVRRFRAAGAASAAYALSAAALQAAWLAHHPRALAAPTPAPAPAPATATAPAPLLIFLFAVHRCLSPWYYFMMKRAALHVTDPRLYEDMEWLERPPPPAPRAR